MLDLEFKLRRFSEHIDTTTLMNTDDISRFCWMQDLEKARNVPARDRKGYEMLLSWFDTWRLGRQLPPGRESARLFWKQQILSKPRAEWQVEQWKSAFG